MPDRMVLYSFLSKHYRGDTRLRDMLSDFERALDVCERGCGHVNLHGPFCWFEVTVTSINDHAKLQMFDLWRKVSEITDDEESLADDLVNINEGLLIEAMAATGQTTAKAAVEEALQRVVEQHQAGGIACGRNAYG